MSNRKAKKDKNLEGAKPITGEILLYLEIIIIGVEGDDISTYHKGRITHFLSYARRNFANFEKIHGDFMLEKEITPHVSQILVRPWGAKVVGGEVVITGNKEDKLDPVWMEFQNDKRSREVVLRQEK